MLCLLFNDAARYRLMARPHQYPHHYPGSYATGNPPTHDVNGKSPRQSITAEYGIKLPCRKVFSNVFHCSGQQDELYHTEGPMQ